ncbi:MAG: PD-(D/E)XK nuclease family protein [Bacilli bacterium]|nr:PD-(D/E)XK nuclease family protein [Bacilli bacterium]
MDFINDLENNSLIICNQFIKERILLELSNNDKFLNLKFMSLKEFYNYFFFNYDEETLYYVKNKYQINLEIANIYLNNLKYVMNSNSNNVKVKFLKDLYLDLKEHKLLKFDNNFKEYLKSKKIIILEDLDDFTLNILNSFNYKIIKKETNNRNNNSIYHFRTIEEEVEYVFNKISELIKNGVSLNNIKIVILGSEYKYILKRFELMYHIPLNNLDNNCIYGTPIVKEFRNLIKEGKSKEEIFNILIDLKDKEIMLKLLYIINKYFFVDNLIDVQDFIDNDLKNTKISVNNTTEAIDIIDLDSYLVPDNSYVFVMGFNNENIPRTYKDIDYFNDELKRELGLFTSFLKNKQEKNKVISNINSIKNITLTYKDSSPYNNYYPSTLIEELNLEIQSPNTFNRTSNLYNKIKFANGLDKFLKYNVRDKELSTLYATYPDINYLSYSNKFKGLDNFKLDKLTLSYSSMNNYYHCKFRYYIDSILKLNIYEESFKQFVGTMFHNILSNMYNKDFNLDELWDKELLGKTFNAKENFYLKDLKEELKNIIKVINYQYSLTGLTSLKLENEITINFKENYKFTGIIDKIMFKEKDNNTYISIIDYKTGIPKVNMANLKYGIDMQLPIYVYLILNSNLLKNPKIIGFYLEQILHEKGNFTDDLDKQILDNLKLQGYSIDDPYLVSMFDSSYENSDMIKSMKTTKNGFYHYSKVLSEDAILKLSDIVKEKIKEAFNSILKGDFSINPKVINGENIGCSYCKYQDICFKKGADLVYLNGENDLTYLENE